MTVAAEVARFLSQHAIGYEVIGHAQTRSLRQAAAVAHVLPSQFARALVVEAAGRRFMVVLPLDHLLDFTALAPLIGANPRLIAVDELGGTFDDCERGCIPPFPHAYGLEGICHESLFGLDHVVFEGGMHDTLLRVDASRFQCLMQGVRRASFARPDASLSEASAGAGVTPPPLAAEEMDRLAPARALRNRVEQIYELPLMPGHAHDLLMLRNRPEAHVDELAELVERDPSLAAQVMKYARAPGFGYSGSLNSVAEAIARVLGFDMVLNLALGLATLKPFRIPPDGPLGLGAFRRHAGLSATLAQRLAQLLPLRERPVPGQLYLCGLLHNFGYLLFGQLFQPEFYLLNRMVAANPQTPVTTLEQRVLCRGQAREAMAAGHAEVGAWLLERWQLPAPVVTAVRYHHDPDYAAEHALYANLILLTDRLLKGDGLGDGDAAELPEAVLRRWNLDAEQVAQQAAEFREQSAGWDSAFDLSVA